MPLAPITASSSDQILNITQSDDQTYTGDALQLMLQMFNDHPREGNAQLYKNYEFMDINFGTLLSTTLSY